MDGRRGKIGVKAWLALLAVAAIAYACALATQAPQTVSIQLVALVRPNTVAGTVYFYDSGVQIGSGDAHGGVVHIVVSMAQGPHSLQAKYVSSVPLYGDSQSPIESYTVDPQNPLVMFGL